MKDNKNKFQIEKPEEIVDEIVNILDGLHVDLTKDAMEISQAKDRFKAIRPYWEGLSNADTNDPDVAEIYSSGTLALSSIRDDYQSIAERYSPLHGTMGTVLPSTNSAVNITSSTASILIVKTMPIDTDWLIPVDPVNRDTLSNKLKALNPDLADTYNAIWEVLYGTRKNPERGSLYLIRQVFDHLFDVLAPDSDVMMSKFWNPKDKNEPHQVTRAEKIEYAAYTHIKDQGAAKRLVASTKHMLDVYKTLNKAHKRGKLDRSQSRASLKEMQAIIEDWVKSLSLRE